MRLFAAPRPVPSDSSPACSTCRAIATTRRRASASSAILREELTASRSSRRCRSRSPTLARLHTLVRTDPGNDVEHRRGAHRAAHHRGDAHLEPTGCARSSARLAPDDARRAVAAAVRHGLPGGVPGGRAGRPTPSSTSASWRRCRRRRRRARHAAARRAMRPGDALHLRLYRRGEPARRCPTCCRCSRTSTCAS